MTSSLITAMPQQYQPSVCNLSLQDWQSKLEDLPPNLLVAVLEHLDVRALLRGAPTVNKLWLSVYKGALHRLDMSCANTEAKAQGAAGWLQKFGQGLQEIRYAREYRYDTGVPAAIIFSAVVHLTQLQSLNLRGINLYLQTQPLTALQSLTSLSLPACNLTDKDLGPIATLVTLQSVDLSVNDSFYTSSEAFAAFSRGLIHLTLLNLGACNLNDYSGLSQLQQLQELGLSCIMEPGLSDLPLMPSLTKLIFQENWAALDYADTKSLSKLQHLDLHGCYLGSSGCALSNLVSLTRLEAVHGHERGDGSRCVLLTALGPLQQLRHLHLSSDFKQGDPISSFSVLGTLHHLTYLELEGPLLPAGALAAMFGAHSANAAVVCLPRLQYLSLSDSAEYYEEWQATGGPITEAELEQLGHGCPQLQTLILDHPVESGALTPLSKLTSLTALTLKDVDAGKHGAMSYLV